MANEYKFTWDHMTICFPEWKKDDTTELFHNSFPITPDFTNEQVSFAYKNGYGVQMYFNDIINPWVLTAPEETKKIIAKVHSDLSHKLYEEVVKKLDDSIETIEGWRKFVSKYNGNEWVGHLQNHIDFKNESELVTLFDYYRFYLGSDDENNSPSSIINKIENLPEASLNETWRRYQLLAKNVSANQISGKTLAECIKNADEIYKIADELKDLKF